MPESIGNKEIFSGYPHCPRCQSKMTASMTTPIPTGNGGNALLQSYVCETCFSGLRLVGYTDNHTKTVRDADCSPDKIQSTKYLSFISICSDSREHAEG